MQDTINQLKQLTEEIKVLTTLYYHNTELAEEITDIRIFCKTVHEYTILKRLLKEKRLSRQKLFTSNKDIIGKHSDEAEKKIEEIMNIYESIPLDKFEKEIEEIKRIEKDN